MDRRTFVRLSGSSIGLLWLAPLGCKSVSSSAKASSLGVQIHSVGSEHLIFDSDSREYRIDPLGHNILSLNDQGGIDNSFGRLGTGPGELNFPIAASLAPDGRLYVVEKGNSRVQVFSPDGVHAATIGSDAHAPSDLVIDERGNIYVCDTRNHEIDVYDRGGNFVLSIGSFATDGAGLNSPRGLALDPQSRLHVADWGNARIQVYSPNGEHLFDYGGYGTRAGRMLGPSSIVINSQGLACVSDPSSGFIHVFAADAQFLGRFRPQDSSGQDVLPFRLGNAPGDQIYVWTGGHSLPSSN